MIASEHQKQIRDSNILVYNFDFDKEFVLYSKTTSKSSEIYSQLRGILDLSSSILRRDSMILTFHVPPLARMQGFCDIDSLKPRKIQKKNLEVLTWRN